MRFSATASSISEGLRKCPPPALGKAGSIAGLTSWAYTVFAPLLPVTDETFRLALSLDARRLGANDRLHVATCLVHSLDAIVSANEGLDEIGASAA